MLRSARKIKNIINLVKPLQVGKIVEGKVIGNERSAIFLDLGPWGTGVIYGKEFIKAKDYLKKLKKGDTVYGKVIELDSKVYGDGFIELSFDEATSALVWDKIRELKAKDETIKVKIIGANRGGLLAKIENISAFLPTSQLSPEHYPKVDDADGNQILAKLQQYIGQEFEVKILSFDPKEGKLILSEKAKQLDKAKKLAKYCKVGDIVDAEITGVTDFGAFVKFPVKNLETGETEYLEGLIHISELDWQLIDHPSEVVQVGEKVKAKITNISNDNRVFLSLKALKEDPWKGIEEKFKVGDVVEGKIAKMTIYGALVQVAPKIQGLCHVSEFKSREKMEEVLKLGEVYKFKIAHLDPSTHRMILKPAFEV